MSSERWEKAKGLFVTALELPDDERETFLDGACAGDNDLRTEVERLLGGDRKAGAEVLEAGLSPELVRESLPDHAIGPYRILSVLGEGGMGTVYLAEQKTPVRRRVALKVIKLGMDSSLVLRRFEAERQALAMMEHTNIARVYEAGVTERGQPYFAMEYVKGKPITHYCDQNKLSLEDRLDLFGQLCSGAQHAHQKGVIHRDLKPSNVLITDQDGKPTAKIIDFGVARATDHRLIEATIFTEQGQIIGTPEYMSPEQAGLDALDIDTRSDVYSLGVLLYELLVGEQPFSAEELRQSGLGEMERKIREEDPPRPSTRLTGPGTGPAVAKLRRTDARNLARRIKGDLDWIVMKALEKDRNRRYQTAIELAQDIERHLADEPVLARPPSAGYRVRKLVRRYRLQVVAAAALLVVLIGGIVGTSIGMIRAEEQTRIADQRADEITRQNEEIRSTAAALQTRTDEFDMLSNVVLLSSSREVERELYPGWPMNLGAMRTWLDGSAMRLRNELPRLRTTVIQLEERVRPGGADGELQFELESDRFLHGTLKNLVAQIELFEQTEIANIEKRIRWAERIETLTKNHPNATVTWDTAIDAIREADGVTASTLYRSDPPFQITPQTGLVPIGMNPATLLWEFYHLRSAWDSSSDTDPASLEIPNHDPETGHIAVGEDTGIIFVLIPGGMYLMGSQPDDPDGYNYDPRSARGETPVHQMSLFPYFIARHELTQSQWMRLSGGDNPSERGPDSPFVESLAHPVERVDYFMCTELMEMHGLVLPTEAQWERGARGDTDTPWWTGSDKQALFGAANLADQSAKRAGAEWISIEDWPELDDGFVRHGPVDSLRPNGFGLYNVHGNVWEWCLDRIGAYQLPRRNTDGLRQHFEGEESRVNRGGSYMDFAADVRSANRGNRAPTVRAAYVGMRAARHVIQ